MYNESLDSCARVSKVLSGVPTCSTTDFVYLLILYSSFTETLCFWRIEEEKKMEMPSKRVLGFY